MLDILSALELNSKLFKAFSFSETIQKLFDQCFTIKRHLKSSLKFKAGAGTLNLQTRLNCAEMWATVMATMHWQLESTE